MRAATLAITALAIWALWRWYTKRPVIEVYRRAIGGKEWTSFVI